MNSSMYLHVKFETKLLPTDVAFKRFFTGMRDGMPLQFVLILEHHHTAREGAPKVPAFMIFHVFF